jgi:hypothetical protein
MERAMTHEEQRELNVLSDADAYPKLQSYYYSFKKEPELAATARRLGRKPVPQMIDVSEVSEPGGLTIYVTRIHESGKARLRELQAKLAAEQREFGQRAS